MTTSDGGGNSGWHYVSRNCMRLSNTATNSQIAVDFCRGSMILLIRVCNLLSEELYIECAVHHYQEA